MNNKTKIYGLSWLVAVVYTIFICIPLAITIYIIIQILYLFTSVIKFLKNHKK